MVGSCGVVSVVPVMSLQNQIADVELQIWLLESQLIETYARLHALRYQLEKEDYKIV